MGLLDWIFGSKNSTGPGPSGNTPLNGAVINIAERTILLKKELDHTESLYQVALNSYGSYMKHHDSENLKNAYHDNLGKYYDSLRALEKNFISFKGMISGAGADNPKDKKIVANALKLVEKFERFKKNNIKFQT